MQMIEVVLPPGAAIKVSLADTDGSFIIDFDSQHDGMLSVSVDGCDDGETVGSYIYQEKFLVT